jgi:murein L,D-transpeptidase YcbB/YkuD
MTASRASGIRLGIVFLCGVGAAACADSRAHPVSESIAAFVSGAAPAGTGRAGWNDVRAFYRLRENRPAWIDGAAPSGRAREALRVIASAGAHGLLASDYDDQRLARSIEDLAAVGGDQASSDRWPELAHLDVGLSAALLRLGRDVAIGRATPAAIDRRWKARREAPDLAASLNGALDGGLAGWLGSIQPRHPEYAALKKALADMTGVRKRGGWPKVPAGVLTRGASHRSVVTLRQRLAATGELAPARRPRPAAQSTYDARVEAAVRAFQEHHALKATGVVDHATLAAMNVGVDDRVRQIAINLDRWRWMPDDFGARHLVVNIPHFHVVAREQGKVVSDIRVVVGKPGNETPVFSSTMDRVVFSPYWNIPDTIVSGETVPAVAKDAGYLARNNIEILRVSESGAERVDPSSVAWDDPDALQDLAFRQRPGARNALGHVKFLFTNPYNVYLHDTPADNLFARRGRAFSHGCIRVEEPAALAKYVLRGQPEWTESRILAAMHSGAEKAVTLREPIPVHIVYFTAWVDAAGGIHFQPDVYGYDRRQK